jgi:hypothetical protein
MISTELASRLATLATLTEGTDVEQAMLRIVDLSKEFLPVIGVSVTVREDGRDFTFVASNELVRDLDERQYDNDGPCTEALRDDVEIASHELATEVRWPTWTALARDAGIGSMLSIPLPNTGLPAVMNMYGVSAHGLDGEDVATLTAVTAAHAGALLHNAEAYSGAVAKAGQLSEAMRSRAGIEQAKGALMAMLAVDESTAWAYLVKLSQHRNDKLRNVAANILREATAGNTRPRRSSQASDTSEPELTPDTTADTNGDGQ